MDLSKTSTRTEKYTLRELGYWNFDYDNDSVMWTNKEQSMYITNLMNSVYPDGSRDFSMYERENDTQVYYIDGQSRMASIYEFTNGISRKGKQVTWCDGDKKVLYETPDVKLKRGYRVMTNEEREFFDNITVNVKVYSFVDKPNVTRKRQVENDTSSHKKQRLEIKVC
jgi:hypothetical protein